MTPLCHPDFAAIVLRKATTDFAHEPIYIVLSTDAERYLPAIQLADIPTSWLGFTSLKLDQQLRPWLESQGKWRGPGFACVLYMDRLAKSASTSAECTYRMIGFVIHEAAHYLEAVAHPIGGRLSTLNEQQMLAIVRDPIWHSYSSRPPPTAADHGAPFLRAALHLWTRCSVSCALPLGYCLIAGAQYGLSCPTLYADALASEFDSLQDQSIVAILQTRPPEAFVDLWLRDRERALA